MTGTPMFSGPILACLKAPDGGGLELENGGLRSRTSGEFLPFVDGVPSLYVPEAGAGEEVTARVKSFYEENPFPNYEGLEEFGELVNKGSRNPFSANLLKAIGYKKLILECGCGTGQLSHYLQLDSNHVLGIDMSLGSLRLAVEHKLRNNLTRSAFAQMNLFNLALEDASFDVVIAHGVLHHTHDARRAFAHMVAKVKPGGVVVVGLYNRYARVPTWIRSKLIWALGPKIDYVVRTRIRDERKADIWIKDQYHNPHETWHTIDQVLRWFEECGVEYMNTTPGILDTDGEEEENLFAKTSPGTAYQRLITQLSWLHTIAREGALFDVIGRKK